MNRELWPDCRDARELPPTAFAYDPNDPPTIPSGVTIREWRHARVLANRAAKPAHRLTALELILAAACVLMGLAAIIVNAQGLAALLAS